jgi:hypothetical protein
MGSLYSTKAKFDDVKQDPKAVEFHAANYQVGNRYPLSLLCYQYLMLLRDGNA